MNIARTGLLLAAMTALFLVVGYLLGGRGGAMIALADRARHQPLRLVELGQDGAAHAQCAAGHPRVARPSSTRWWQELAQRAQLPMPAIYLIETDQPNAFATGRDPHHSAVAVTRGLMQSLSRDELAGVIAHELAHIKNRDTLTMTIAATIAGAIGFLGQFAFFFGGSRDGERTNPMVAILVMILAPLAATLVQMAISRTREFSADRLGAQICGMPRGAGRRPAADRAAGHRPGHAHGRAQPGHRRTCSSSIRCGWAGSTICSAPIPRTEDRIRALLALEQEGGVGRGRRPRRACATAACRARAGAAGRGPDAARHPRAPACSRWRPHSPTRPSMSPASLPRASMSS